LSLLTPASPLSLSLAVFLTLPTASSPLLMPPPSLFPPPSHISLSVACSPSLSPSPRTLGVRRHATTVVITFLHTRIKLKFQCRSIPSIFGMYDSNACIYIILLQFRHFLPCLGLVTCLGQSIEFSKIQLCPRAQLYLPPPTKTAPHLFRKSLEHHVLDSICNSYKQIWMKSDHASPRYD
jgi:hypothetical protein